MSNWIMGRYGGILPWAAFFLVLVGTFFVDQHWLDEQAASEEAVEARAQEQTSHVADALGNIISERMGALAAPKMRFTPVEDSVSERTFAAAVDSVTAGLVGLAAISVVDSTGTVEAGADAIVGRPGFDPRVDSVVRLPFQRAIGTGQPAATGVLQRLALRRVVLFDPVVRGESAAPVAALAAELDPNAVFREALAVVQTDSPGSGFFTLYGPNGARITAQATPANWPLVERPVRVADTEWTVALAYAPPNRSAYRTARVATWATGLAVAAALATVLMILRGTVGRQQEEIRRREEAERQARAAAQEAKERASETRQLTEKLEAAHGAAQKLSSSLDPDFVAEFFLGAVAEVLNADTASLFTFDEEGDLLVGRRRLVLRDVGPETDRMKEEDIREVRVPTTLVPPQLAEAIATGEPQLMEDATIGEGGRGVPFGGPTAAAWVTIPLHVGGHMIGVANWEVFRGSEHFDPTDIAFAQALAAQAASALRAADLYASLENASARATDEAARFGAVLDQMADGVVIVDSRGKVERFNAAAEGLLGHPPKSGAIAEWIDELDLATADQRPISTEDFPILRSLVGETVRRAGFVSRSPAREDTHLSASSTPIVSESERTGAALIVRDVTDEQQYAAMLRHTNQELRKQATLLEDVNRQLREATTAKDQFLAMMSHELRTPVNAIMGYADLLDLGIKGPLNDAQRHMVGRTILTARHLLRLMDEILDLAKISSGQVDMRLEPVPLREVVERALDQVTPLAHAKGLAVEIAGEREEPGQEIHALADRTRLTQVVLNLLSNAVKFTEEGVVSVSYRRNGSDTVELSVRDTGPGIPEDLHDRIFEEFYQIESGLTRTAGGTGLGLAITRRFTRLMGGEVSVKSRPKEGAQFTVRLPTA